MYWDDWNSFRGRCGCQCGDFPGFPIGPVPNPLPDVPGTAVKASYAQLGAQMEQSVPAGSSFLLNYSVMQEGTDISHAINTAPVVLEGGATYFVAYSVQTEAQTAAEQAETEQQVGLLLNGTPVPGSAACNGETAVNALMGAQTLLQIPAGCSQQLVIGNTGQGPITASGVSLSIMRIA